MHLTRNRGIWRSRHETAAGYSKKTAAGGLDPAAACNQPEGGEPDYDRIRAKGRVRLASIALRVMVRGAPASAVTYL